MSYGQEVQGYGKDEYGKEDEYEKDYNGGHASSSMGYGGHETSMAAHETSKAMGSHESSKFYQYGYEGSSIAEATALAPPFSVTHFRTIHET